MSVSLIFDVEYYDTDKREWVLLEDNIDTFHCHPLREYMRDTSIGYDSMSPDFNAETASKLKDSNCHFTKLLYRNQLNDIIREVKELRNPDEDQLAVAEAAIGTIWIVQYLLNKLDRYIWVDEQIRLVFYTE